MLQLEEMVYAQGEATKEENETISINASQAQSSMGPAQRRQAMLRVMLSDAEGVIYGSAVVSAICGQVIR